MCVSVSVSVCVLLISWLICFTVYQPFSDHLTPN